MSEKSAAKVSVVSSESDRDQPSFSTNETVDEAIKDFIVEDDRNNYTAVIGHVLNKIVGNAMSNELEIDLSQSESQVLTRTLISLMKKGNKIGIFGLI